MFTRLNICRAFKKRTARFAALALLAGAFVTTSINLGGHIPAAPGTVEAGCFTLAGSQCEVIRTISVCLRIVQPGGNAAPSSARTSMPRR